MRLRSGPFLLLNLSLTFTASLAAQTSSGALPKPAVQASAGTSGVIARLSFSQQIKKTIAIIYTTCVGDTQTYEGTGFFVYKQDARLGDNRGFLYLVTNRHVVQPHVESGKPCTVAKQMIRINAKMADPVTGARNALFTVGDEVHWTYPTDDAVDLAAIPFAPDQARFDIEPIPMSMFATRDVVKKENISEGDSVLYVGFFYQFPGNLQIEPIIRQGIIAMIPSEPILTTLGKLGRAYLADAHVFGGNSGSPMFVNLSGERNGALMVGERYLFLGVVSGLEPEETDVALQPVTTYSGKISANSGISFIIPADQVAELINGPAMTDFREKVISTQQLKVAK